MIKLLDALLLDFPIGFGIVFGIIGWILFFSKLPISATIFFVIGLIFCVMQFRRIRNNL